MASGAFVLVVAVVVAVAAVHGDRGPGRLAVVRACAWMRACASGSGVWVAMRFGGETRRKASRLRPVSIMTRESQ